MNHLASSTAFLLVSLILSHARHTFFLPQNEELPESPSTSESNVCLTPECVQTAADVLSDLDETVDPCDDFNRFACGGFMKRFDNKQYIYDVLTLTASSLNQKLRELLEREHENSDPPFIKMVKDFYQTCMRSVEEGGSEPLKRLLARLGGWPVVEGDKWDESKFDWVDSVTALRSLGFDSNTLLRLYWKSEIYRFKRANRIFLDVPSLDKTLYRSFLSHGMNDSTTIAYFQKMVKAAKLLGAEESIVEEEMLDTMDFMMTLANLSTFDSNLRRYTVEELQKLIPKIPWLKYINGILNDEIYENETVILTVPNYFTKLAELITSTEKRVIANYMMWRAVEESMEYVSLESTKIAEEQKSVKNQWYRCLEFVTEKAKIALSSYYVRHYFNNGSKEEALILYKYIQQEFIKMLEENDWMDEETKKKAQEKAKAINANIGYPKELLNDTAVMEIYENLTSTNESYLENILNLNKWSTDKKLSNLRKLVIKKGWEEYGNVIDAQGYYDGKKNTIEVPAGILHDTFFDKDRPKYLNFGGIGYVLGHEITHGFDDDGRRRDKDGKDTDWWDEYSDKHFRKKVKCIIDQYNNYTTDIGIKVNGIQTQNENIADNGGLRAAYWAYNTWTKDNGLEPLLPGLNYTQSQLFWINAARVHCEFDPGKPTKMSKDVTKHTPVQFRIIGPMSNLPEFSIDFNCSADSPMNRKNKCKVW